MISSTKTRTKVPVDHLPSSSMEESLSSREPNTPFAEGAIAPPCPPPAEGITLEVFREYLARTRISYLLAALPPWGPPVLDFSPEMQSFLENVECESRNIHDSIAYQYEPGIFPLFSPENQVLRDNIHLWCTSFAQNPEARYFLIWQDPSTRRPRYAFSGESVMETLLAFCDAFMPTHHLLVSKCWMGQIQCPQPGNAACDNCRLHGTREVFEPYASPKLREMPATSPN
jgi:hypothetical protein